MKRIFTILSIFLISMSALAQFKVVHGGFASEKGKSFIVVEGKGNKKQLFNKVKTRLMSMFVNPNKVLSYNEPDIITVNGVTSGIFFHYNYGHLNPTFQYKMNIFFKDNKVRFDAPIVVGSIYDGNVAGMYYSLEPGKSYRLAKFYTFFKKDGSIREKEAITAMEEYFNNLVVDIMTEPEKTEEEIPEDW